jgi:uncharacterized membrane protein
MEMSVTTGLLLIVSVLATIWLIDTGIDWIVYYLRHK